MTPLSSVHMVWVNSPCLNPLYVLQKGTYGGLAENTKCPYVRAFSVHIFIVYYTGSVMSSTTLTLIKLA